MFSDDRSSVLEMLWDDVLGWTTWASWEEVRARHARGVARFLATGGPRPSLGHHPLPWREVGRLLDQPVVRQACHVADLGSGAGRICLALEGHVTAITGVEIDRELHLAAAANRQRAHAESVCLLEGDVREHTDTLRRADLWLFHNSFAPEVLAELLGTTGGSRRIAFVPRIVPGHRALIRQRAEFRPALSADGCCAVYDVG